MVQRPKPRSVLGRAVTVLLAFVLVATACSDDTDDADKLEQITGEADVTAMVTELLGLDFGSEQEKEAARQDMTPAWDTARPVAVPVAVEVASVREAS